MVVPRFFPVASGVWWINAPEERNRPALPLLLETMTWAADSGGVWVRRLIVTSKVATAVSHTSQFARLEAGRRSAGITRGPSAAAPRRRAERNGGVRPRRRIALNIDTVCGS